MRKEGLTFLQGGGEMAELMRNFDWEKTCLGDPENWPLSLRTTVGMILHSAFPMFLFWGKDLLCFYNDAYRPSLGKDGKHPLIGRKGNDAWPEIWEFIGPLIEQVMSTGEPAWYEDQLLPIFRNGRMEDVYWTFSYSAAYGDDGEIAGVFVTCTETTGKVRAIEALQDSRDRLKFAIDAAELGTWDLNPLTNEFTGNARLKEWFGLNPDDEITLSLATDVIAEKDRDRVKAAIARALNFDSGGHYDVEYTIQNPLTGKETIVKAKGKASFNEQQQPYNFSGTLQDLSEEANVRKQLATEVTEQLKAKKELEESNLFSNNVFYNSPVAKLVFVGRDMIIERVNEGMLELLGRDQSIIGKPFLTALPELEPTPLMGRLKKVFSTGETFTQPEERIALLRFGIRSVGYYNYIYKALFSTMGEIYGVMATATDVTAQVAARNIIEEKEKELRDLIVAAPIGICVVSGDPLWVDEVNDRFLIITGKPREQFLTKPYWEVLREIAPHFQTVLAHVFSTGFRYSSEEYEMNLIRNGVEEKIFATFEYVPIVDIEGVVIKVIILAVEVTHQVETRRKIENAVTERTKELAATNLNLLRSNEELEQFAYIASHDLQEPIRKISMFTEMLEDSIENISDHSKTYISKIYNSTDRMTKLIRDVLAFSQISQTNDYFVTVKLPEIFKSIESDFELLIADTGATFEIENLPTIDAIPGQMIQLFSNLMSNALKFTRSGVKPLIKITSSNASKEVLRSHPTLTATRKYYHIKFSDNGIGFDQQHADRIFKIFQRLHGRTQYEGTGIGLAICRKIVQSHHGHIYASVNPDGGALFNIILPECVFD
ncbi:MAG: PAS domain-containing protein [Chryseolinea sp.]